MSSSVIGGAPPQQIRFCRAVDGTRIAYAVHGSGPPLVIATCWLSHLQFDWESPVWRHFLADLGEFATIVRFDERGHGLSDWNVTNFSLEARISDLEAVVDDARLDRFALMAMSQGGPVVLHYVARHPERVSRLLFYGSYAAVFRDPTPEELALSDAFEQMIKVGWARPDSVFRRVFTSMMIPGATEEQMRWLDELQRVAVSAENAYAGRQERNKADATELLEKVHVPTLVLHSLDDRMNSFDEARLVASTIPGARLVPLESSNHILLVDEPAWALFRYEVASFLEAEQGQASHPPREDPLSPLTGREVEVLTLAAEGLDNEGIAGALTLSVRTVERHMQNIYGKLDIRSRSPRAAAVARLLTRP